MLKDRYGLAVSTTSATARDAYVQGCDLYLSVYPGAVAAFDRAIAAARDARSPEALERLRGTLGAEPSIAAKMATVRLV